MSNRRGRRGRGECEGGIKRRYSKLGVKDMKTN